MSKNKKFFLICLTEAGKGFDRGWPMDRLPKTRKQCEDALKWQQKGGFDTSEYRIATASDIPGIFEFVIDRPVATVRPILFERGPYTESAFREITLQLWGQLV